MKIPIANLYYLLIYAWNKLEEGELVDVSDMQSTELVDLFARVLASGMNHLLRRGLDRGYTLEVEAIPGIRGKLQLSDTLKRATSVNGKAVCAFDELTHDTQANRIFKATIGILLSVRELSKDSRDVLWDLHKRLPTISNVRLSPGSFRGVQLHRNNGFNGFLLDVCRLIYDNALVDETAGNIVFRDFIRDEKKMALLFQQFVFNLLKREQRKYTVKSSQLRWRGAEASDPAAGYLPVMQTDIVLGGPERCLVVDTKFYLEALQSSEHRKTIRSAHLYQLYAYMRNIEPSVDAGVSVEGLLLYPLVEQSLDLSYVLDGHKVSVKTLDLSQPWSGIKADLLGLAA